jgi:prepilin-type N-terminal cleavage/methylation domain-containing protein
MIWRSQTTSGYTLLELVLVLAILATALAMVAPSLSGFIRGRKTEESAAQFVALTHWARSQAISDGASYQINLDPAGGRWWISVEEGDTYTDVSGPFGRVYAVGDGVELQTDIPAVDGKRTITFDPAGRSDVGVVRFVGNGGMIEVACDAPVDEFHVVQSGGSR